MSLLPHEILNEQGEQVYSCRVCWKKTDLHWFQGTSCPVCDDPECTDWVASEFRRADWEIVDENMGGV